MYIVRIGGVDHKFNDHKRALDFADSYGTNVVPPVYYSGESVYYAIIAWQGLGEFKNETFTQVLSAETAIEARTQAHVWAHTHLSHEVVCHIVVSEPRFGQ